MGGTFFALAFFAFAALTTVDLLMNERAVVSYKKKTGKKGKMAGCMQLAALLQ